MVCIAFVVDSVAQGRLFLKCCLFYMVVTIPWIFQFLSPALSAIGMLCLLWTVVLALSSFALSFLQSFRYLSSLHLSKASVLRDADSLHFYWHVWHQTRTVTFIYSVQNIVATYCNHLVVSIYDCECAKETFLRNVWHSEIDEILNVIDLYWTNGKNSALLNVYPCHLKGKTLSCDGHLNWTVFQLQQEGGI